ncbi:MAG TPA: chemoreceptor glutamine deamidase CheD [Pseudomonas sp.]|jgi:chemotaxis protein CheD|nr:chemotaxis protein CheD [Pseudomonadales bacterium]MEE2797965.1 chemoreceptor glutamine deamidase CheD [Pseudomonadota bacterium]HCB43752.1 chemoreceptor glutamine deamidase CheD [Pseudomonas sp.]HCL42022.1 chemoreceptor glutamine deamidase CheD [Pseudomonas sp.]|tara:strand:- start:1244 stop:1855 length:612 start_codon:yes stop_codon:yes gene_type:complete
MSSATAEVAMNQYYDRYFDRQATKILPGEYYATSEPEVIVTVLGSCVSACVRDRVNGIGGMNHFLLPLDGSAEPDKPTQSARYGSYAMELLINQVIKLGGHRERLEAKVFGGAAVLRGMLLNDVGKRNAEFVEQYLRNEHIPIVAADLLQDFPRKVYFFPETGQVWVKRIRRIKNDTIFERERAYRQRVKEDVDGGSVELFEE